MKVYQLKMACAINRSICVYAPATYDSVYNSLKLGGGGCTTALPPSSSTVFRASDHIQLDAGFKLDASSQTMLLVVPCEGVDQQYIHQAIPHGPVITPVEFIQRHWYDHNY